MPKTLREHLISYCLQKNKLLSLQPQITPLRSRPCYEGIIGLMLGICSEMPSALVFNALQLNKIR